MLIASEWITYIIPIRSQGSHLYCLPNSCLTNAPIYSLMATVEDYPKTTVKASANVQWHRITSEFLLPQKKAHILAIMMPISQRLFASHRWALPSQSQCKRFHLGHRTSTMCLCIGNHPHSKKLLCQGHQATVIGRSRVIVTLSQSIDREIWVTKS